MKIRILAFLLYCVVRLLNGTLRVRQVRQHYIDDTPQYILAFWHMHLVPLLSHARWRKPITVMSSRSKDGELSATVLSWYGAETVRGSSSQGATGALRGLLREARAGKNIVFTPDGPRGPAQIVKQGMIYSAQVTGLPIVPVAFATKKKKVLRSWDRMHIPKPFSRGLCLYGEPFVIPRDGDMEEWRLKSEQILDALAEEAERMVNET